MKTMKLTESMLRTIIKEELKKVLKENVENEKLTDLLANIAIGQGGQKRRNSVSVAEVAKMLRTTPEQVKMDLQRMKEADKTGEEFFWIEYPGTKDHVNYSKDWINLDDPMSY